jgi:hypothetical protein
MVEQEKVIIEEGENSLVDEDWKVRVLAIGVVVGALTGLGAAYLLLQRAKRRAEPPNLNASEGIKLGLLVFGLLRQVAMLGSGDDK